jgi:hypothetical protein
MGCAASVWNTASQAEQREQNMARMDFAATPQVAGGPTHWELLDPAQVAKDEAEPGPWSIDEEPIGGTLRD